MTTKQDKTVPFIKADLIKRVNRYNVGNTSCLELRHACNYISHHYVERKFNQDLYFKSDYKSIEAVNHNYKRKEKLAARLEREFLRKEEKEKDQLKIIFDLTPIPMGDYITIKHINGSITSIYELKNIQSAIANQCIKLGFDTGKTYSCKVVRKSENQEDTLFIGYLDEIYDVIDFKTLDE